MQQQQRKPECQFSADVAAGARAGDAAALEQVYRLLVGPLTSYLRSQVGDPDAAADLAQEAFVDLVRRCRTLEGGPREIRSWLYRAARNKAIDRSRYRSRRPETLTDEVPDAPSASPGPETVADAADRATSVRRLLASLPADQCQVLTLRFLGELTAPEVAAVMGRTEGAVRALQHRGVAALGRALRAGADAERLERLVAAA